MLLKAVLHTGPNGGFADLRGVKTSNIPSQPREQAINSILPMGTLIQDGKQTYYT